MIIILEQSDVLACNKILQPTNLMVLVSNLKLFFIFRGKYNLPQCGSILVNLCQKLRMLRLWWYLVFGQIWFCWSQISQIAFSYFRPKTPFLGNLTQFGSNIEHALFVMKFGMWQNTTVLISNVKLFFLYFKRYPKLSSQYYGLFYITPSEGEVNNINNDLFVIHAIDLRPKW